MTGTADPVAAILRGKSFFDSLPAATPKQKIEIPGASHDNVHITDYPICGDIAECCGM